MTGSPRTDLGILRRHNPNLVGRLRWWLLPHVGYYCDGTDMWRWWMSPARWSWIALGWLTRSELFR